MVPARALLCGCRHARGCSPIGLATGRGHGRSTARAARGRHAAAPAREASANPGVRGFSPPPPAVSPIRGLIDFHTHAAPDVFGRAVDDDELASQAAARQMEAVVTGLEAAGISKEQIQTMGREVPGALLMG